MAGAPRILLILSAIAFIIAVVGTVAGDVGTIPPEEYSRASTNLALLAIAIHLTHARQQQRRLTGKIDRLPHSEPIGSGSLLYCTYGTRLRDQKQWLPRLPQTRTRRDRQERFAPDGLSDRSAHPKSRDRRSFHDTNHPACGGRGGQLGCDLETQPD